MVQEMDSKSFLDVNRADFQDFDEQYNVNDDKPLIAYTELMSFKPKVIFMHLYG